MTLKCHIKKTFAISKEIGYNRKIRIEEVEKCLFQMVLH